MVAAAFLTVLVAASSAFAQGQVSLIVRTMPAGFGTVVGYDDDPGTLDPVISCSSDAGADCGVTYRLREACETAPPALGCPRVTLVAVPVPGASFDHWSGDCRGSSPVCTVTMFATRVVVATFRAGPPALPAPVPGPFVHTLSAALAGTGSGTVTAWPPGIVCPFVCSQLYYHGTVVVLVASPAPGSGFAGWGGACAGFGASSPCVLAVSSDLLATAWFVSGVPVAVGGPVAIGGPGSGCDIVGTPGDDVLVGTPDDETICGLGGNDVLLGGGGDDVLIGGTGRDSLDGGGEDDVLLGGSGDDSLQGGDGDDLLRGGSGDDVLTGGTGDDLLAGGSGRDVASGGDGTDECVAEVEDSC